MRIVSGTLKGRRFDPPIQKWKTRPTTDYAKESLFNILAHRLDFEGLEVADLYAGSGSITYEFASRGAARVSSVERYADCVRYMRQQLQTFGIQDQVELHQKDVLQWLKRSDDQFDVIFADPPYAAAAHYAQLIDLVLSRGLLRPEGHLILEHDSRQNFAKYPNFVELRQYGQSYFSLLAAASSS